MNCLENIVENVENVALQHPIKFQFSFVYFLIVAKRQLNRILIFHHTSFLCCVLWGEKPLSVYGINIKELLL